MKLKNILVAGAIAVSTLGATSCSNFLDINPTDAQTSDTFFRTSVEARQALNGVYEKLRSDYNGTIPNNNALIEVTLGDDAYVGGAASGTDMLWLQQMMRFQALTNSESALQTWNKCYGAIQRANTLLANYDKITFKSNEEDLKNNYKGEATYLRAHFYFELVRYFENIPLITNILEGESWTEVTQEEPAKVYAQIAKDMTDAIDLMAEEIDASEAGRLTKYAAMSELVKVYLFYTGVYGTTELPVEGGAALTQADMIQMADDVINSGRFTLAANYADLFNESGNYNPEVIFEIAFANTGSGDWGDWSYGNIMCQMAGPRAHNGPTFAQGWGFIAPSRELEQSFEAGDTRLPATIMYAKDLIDEVGSVHEAHYNYTGMHSNKYTTHAWNRADVNVELNWAQNYHYIRLADVYLMAAELNLSGNPAKATQYVNVVRSRAGLADKTLVTLADIQQERRVELAFEGHRYFDVLRRGLNEAKQELDVTNYTLTPPTHTDPQYINDQGENLTGDIAADPTIFEISFDVSKKGFLPIPQVEIDLHPLLKQNAGY
ncbi:RagB/SusD family nutrient uptake outer membrane protein [Flammeovirga sp. MY04]|uniref:RagB/SusD family nutrient uptake outer membrane protein n=1 Tax=Flammeovirga sp. MY04 TaxID=1191459 RepID=UPI0008240764|nr:RagB/SusD family nutrient uptake outer membrane protein [Flammeovirga sp. MY04]ANQ49283.2 RagB/SusD family nutrient uptake outer membrane protein [Flammeovirga sp. MY04]